MPKLFLVGITPDHRGLVLSDHARAKRGDMVLEIDDRLIDAIEKANRLRYRDEGHRLESAALPSKREDVNGDAGIDRLSPREIQQRLRAGETVAALARSSGTDEAWIRRFATPVLAEQARMVERARSLTVTKRGVGPSGATLGPAVAANVLDRGVPLTLPDLEAGWGAYQHPEGGWRVTFTFPLRGRRQTAEWELDTATGELTARNKLAGELGWREQGKKLPLPKPAKAPPPKRSPETAKPETAKPETAKPETAKPETAKPETAEPEPDSPPAATTGEPADPQTAKPASEERNGTTAEAAQELPLDEAAPLRPAGAVRKAPARKAAPRKAAPRKAALRKAPESGGSTKRAAAAVTETPGRVVAVPPADRARS
ncbi:MAG TPA: septation protein SepH, partial [Acidimicrobiia bacterium]|nr:septation protein SepH [Acidimicrobiia bacterium]